MLATVAVCVGPVGANAGWTVAAGEPASPELGVASVSGDPMLVWGLVVLDELELERARFDSALKPSNAARTTIATLVSVRSGRRDRTLVPRLGRATSVAAAAPVTMGRGASIASSVRNVRGGAGADPTSAARAAIASGVDDWTSSCSAGTAPGGGQVAGLGGAAGAGVRDTPGAEAATAPRDAVGATAAAVAAAAGASGAGRGGAFGSGTGLASVDFVGAGAFGSAACRTSAGSSSS